MVIIMSTIDHVWRWRLGRHEGRLGRDACKFPANFKPPIGISLESPNYEFAPLPICAAVLRLR